MTISLTTVDIAEMLRAGYAVRTAQQFESYGLQERISLAKAVTATIAGANPDVVAAYLGNPENRQIAHDIVQQVQHMRWPTFAAVAHVYRQVHGVAVNAEHNIAKIDSGDAEELFAVAYRATSREAFFEEADKRCYSALAADHLWAVAISVRNGDIVLPTATELFGGTYAATSL